MKKNLYLYGIISVVSIILLCAFTPPKPLRGIDVSHHQNRIEWQKVAADNIDFVYIKATEGKTYTDPCFHYNIREAKKAGLLVGVYHFFRMTSSPTEQFKNFQKAVGQYKFDLIPMIDVETSDGHSKAEMQKCLDEFITLIKKEYGVMPMIYGTQRSYNTYCAPKYNHLHLYIGRYKSSEPPQINGKGTYTIWQYSEQGRVKGISKDVDMCKFHPKHSIAEIKIN